jgi:hypothetical protein
VDPDRCQATGVVATLPGQPPIRHVRSRQPKLGESGHHQPRPPVGLLGVAGGFAKGFTDLGARAVIAPLWDVKDTIAYQIAEEFYRKVRANPRTPFGEILSRIRAKAYDSGAEDTYAAYCFYGDPVLAAEVSG